MISFDDLSENAFLETGGDKESQIRSESETYLLSLSISKNSYLLTLSNQPEILKKNMKEESLKNSSQKSKSQLLDFLPFSGTF
jgi:hypothetical protein